jgi:hypothetical protein
LVTETALAVETEDTIRILIDPYYAINVDPALATKHQTLVSKGQWVRANRQLIAELGVEEWLVYLLSVLEGDFPRSPEDAAIVLAATRTASRLPSLLQ